MQRAVGVIYFVVVHVSTDISLDIVYDTLYLTVSTSQCQRNESYQNESETNFLHLSVLVEFFFTSDPFANNLDVGHSQKNNGFNALTNLYFNSNFQKKQNTE